MLIRYITVKELRWFRMIIFLPYRDKIERKLVESSEEARRELRLNMMKEMMRMQKLIDVHKFIERYDEELNFLCMCVVCGGFMTYL